MALKKWSLSGCFHSPGTRARIGCDNAAALQAQYQAVIDKYKVSVLDLDIEGKSLDDAASVDRRNAALAAIEAANPAVQVRTRFRSEPTG